MDTRIELKNNDRLLFSDMECTIDHALGRGSNVIAYVGQYRDYKYPSIKHRVLIRELFPYDPKGPFKSFYKTIRQQTFNLLPILLSY